MVAEIRPEDIHPYSTFFLSFEDLSQDIDLVSLHPQRKPCRYLLVPIDGAGDVMVETSYRNDGEAYSPGVTDYHQAKLLSHGLGAQAWHFVATRRILASGTTATKIMAFW